MHWTRTNGCLLLALLTALTALEVVAGAQAEPGFGRFRALVVGNQNYQHLRRLETPLVDAEKVARVLEEQYGFEVQLLRDASRLAIMQALNQLGRTAKADDNLLIYYAGHGTLESDMGYWQPTDAEEDSDANSIPTLQITRKLNAVQARHVLIVADSCYAGSLTTRGLGLQQPNGESWNAWLLRMQERRSRTALTSGGLEPVLDKGGGDHSVFAKAFLEALQSNQNVLDGSSLFDRIKAAVANSSPQTPQYGYIPGTEGNSGDFLLVPKQLQNVELASRPDSSSIGSVKEFRSGTASLRPVDAEFRAAKDGPVRQVPRAGSSRLWSLKKGDLVWVAGELTAEDVSWYLVEREQEQGYVLAALLEKPAAGQPESPAVPALETKSAASSTTLLQSPAAEPKPGQILREETTGIELVWVPKGCFLMGSEPGTEAHQDDELPVHEVCVDGLWLGRLEVTQGQWERVMGSNPSHFKGADLPVEQVSWHDVQEFVAKLNASTGGGWRLPTEAEWEHACRAGGTSRHCGGDDLDAVAWHYGNSGRSTHLVGIKQANGFGLHDMSGNVAEWCSDWYDAGYYKKQAGDNPQGPESGKWRVVRGGSWDNLGWHCRSAYRDRSGSVGSSWRFGFRLARGRTVQSK